MQLNDSYSAIVTGAASGLGAETAHALQEKGVKVLGIDLPQALDALDDQAIPGVEYQGVDVTDVDAVRKAVRQAASLAPLRVAVNCAGIAPSQRILSRRGPHDPQLFSRTININLLGTFHVLSSAAEIIAESDPWGEDGQRGVIINTSSVAAFEGQVGQAAYSASKGAVHALSITAARDLASMGIRVNAIAPGVVATPMMKQITEEFRKALEANVPFPARLAKPEEFAKLVLSIIDNDYINGQTIRLDGALRMPPR
ncbi:SDR family oxidoreductase [Corynebacterium poyangense]|uniref:SDR family oxidoreductase n=1 Tax=Corynebacterium poyangense TaxID=2684405 RepID=A0A7H0SL67_9CORY|nr:SDR family NAD(P)-dependent oxidoreductase [Corynebacterium poyangense]MBZ8177380.1 SDR family oxidoreductase [Corynebacterium poyangense]QNQ89292.1 SDR family oxidoreductase [Corynebacterium poyangense]